MDTNVLTTALTVVGSLVVGIITAVTTMQSKRNDLVQPVIDGYSKIVAELRSDKTELQHQVNLLQAEINQLRHDIAMLRAEISKYRVDNEPSGEV